jgi:hypothetical protein
MIKANTKEELDKIREQHPFVTTAYLKDGCPHCEGLKPVLEDECSKMNVLTVGDASPIATVHCPVTQDFCANELVQTVIDGYKDSKGIKGELSAKDKENIRVGVPLVIGKYEASKNQHSLSWEMTSRGYVKVIPFSERSLKK